MIKLFRILTSKSNLCFFKNSLVKATENFAAALKDYESAQKGNFEFISALVENIRIDDYQYAIDVILLISTLSQNNEKFRDSIKGNKKITAFMNAFINFYKVSQNEVNLRFRTSLKFSNWFLAVSPACL